MLVNEYLTKSAKKFPEKVALSFGENIFTYKELDATTNRLGNFLASKNTERGDRIAFFLLKSHFTVISIFGILKASAIYVPIDPNAPTERILKILNDCGIKILISQADKMNELKKLSAEKSDLKCLIIDKNLDSSEKISGNFYDAADWLALGDAELVSQSIDSEPAYIIYTSGSTGQPKGVVISHRNINGLINFVVERFNITSLDRMSNHPPAHFDLTTLDIFSAVSAGAALYPVPEEYSLFPQKIVNFINENRLTVWHSAPFLLSYIAKLDALRENDCQSLRYVFWAGEVFPVKFLRYWMRKLPDKKFFNLFGPTETTDISLYYEVQKIPDENDKPTPIGKPCFGEDAFAIDSDGRRVMEGGQGELYFKGVGVGLGYWNDPQKTSENFVQNPLHNNYTDIVYKTGDLVRLLPDGNWEFLGRADHQIKCRGYRIELGEIETALYLHPSVGECAVVPFAANDMGDSELKAFLVLKNGCAADASGFTEFLKEKIPHYMLPHYFEFLNKMPLTSTGKIDRVKLKQGLI